MSAATVSDPADWQGLGDLVPLLRELDPSQIAALVADLPPSVVETLLNETATVHVAEIPAHPGAQASRLDFTYRDRTHLQYLSARLAHAIERVEQGHNVMLRVSMPPRMGKSTLGSLYFPTWVLRKHADWKVGVLSHGSSLATSWGRGVRRLIENHDLGLAIAPDLGAASEWETTEHGGMLARGLAGDITGRGFKVLLIDDLVKGYTEAHSETARESLWDKWTSDIFTRLEPPYLVAAIGTRWHEDDFLGRLASTEHEGDPNDWEIISFPAIATTNDVLGREPGEPLLSPLMDETPEEALARWADIKASVGTYAWDALYQQDPQPSKGVIFDADWWQHWTVSTRPKEFTRTITSWDCAFKDTDGSDYVVGQRWGIIGPDRYLLEQVRGRWSFTATLEHIETFAGDTHEHLIEDKANGPAVIDVLKKRIPGVIPINPGRDSKEARARAITPECESGNVYLPHPSMPGFSWVPELLSELQAFPNGANDDQVDALTQALNRLRGPRDVTVLQPRATVTRGYTAGSGTTGGLRRAGR